MNPGVVDTFRPQLDNQVALVVRLRKAGATHVFVGGDGDDIVIMGHDATPLNAGIIFASGKTLRVADRALLSAEGRLMVTSPE